MISKTIGCRGLHNIFRQTHMFIPPGEDQKNGLVDGAWNSRAGAGRHQHHGHRGQHREAPGHGHGDEQDLQIPK